MTKALLTAHPAQRTRLHHTFKIPGQTNELAWAVIRNPYDVLATWLCLAPRSIKTIPQLIEEYSHSWFHKDYRLFSWFPVDFNLKYENLEPALFNLMAELDLACPTLPHLNPTPKKKHYSTYYRDEDIDYVTKRFPEIHEYGYTFQHASR
jgi:hypothetical protein